jgi:hypothetical protein
VERAVFPLRGRRQGVTFRLYPENRVQLVFHRGAKVKSDGGDFAFEDDTGLLRWVADDRAVVALRDAKDLFGHYSDLHRRSSPQHGGACRGPEGD